MGSTLPRTPGVSRTYVIVRLLHQTRKWVLPSPARVKKNVGPRATFFQVEINSDFPRLDQTPEGKAAWLVGFGSSKGRPRLLWMLQSSDSMVSSEHQLNSNSCAIAILSRETPGNRQCQTVSASQTLCLWMPCRPFRPTPAVSLSWSQEAAPSTGA